MGNFYLYQIAQFLVRCLPLKAAYAVAIALADAHYLLSKADRLAVTANLKVITGRAQVPPAMVRDVFRNFAKYLADFFLMEKFLTHEYIKTHVHIDNIDCLDEVLKKGKGCIMVSAHLGNWELAAAVFTILKYPFSAVALPHKDPRVNKFFNDKRAHFGVRIISTAVAIRRCMEELKAKGLVALLAERDFNQHGMIMDFLGRPTMIPKGAALFALKTGTPIMPAFFTRRDGDHFYFRFHDVIYPPSIPDGQITDAHIRALIAQYVPVIEKEIRQEPTQWLMFREFWVS